MQSSVQRSYRKVGPPKACTGWSDGRTANCLWELPKQRPKISMRKRPGAGYKGEPDNHQRPKNCIRTVKCHAARQHAARQAVPVPYRMHEGCLNVSSSLIAVWLAIVSVNVSLTVVGVVATGESLRIVVQVSCLHGSQFLLEIAQGDVAVHIGKPQGPCWSVKDCFRRVCTVDNFERAEIRFVSKSFSKDLSLTLFGRFN